MLAILRADRVAPSSRPSLPARRTLAFHYSDAACLQVAPGTGTVISQTPARQTEVTPAPQASESLSACCDGRAPTVLWTAMKHDQKNVINL